MNRRIRGFTLIELIVVIAVIGILAAVTIVGLGRYQADTRDARRASNATVIAEALEKYYDENGEYPGCLALETDPNTVTTNVLKGVNQSALVAPQAPTGQENSIKCLGDPELTLSSDDFFQYEGDGSEACASGMACLAFNLKYRDEVDGEIKSISSRRTTQISTSGNITLSGSALDSSSVALNWNAIPNATDYTIQRADDNTFSAGLSESNSTTNSTIVGGLVRGEEYSFRVRANSVGSQSNWSNTANITTLDLYGPTITSTSGTTSTITVNWDAVAGATSYRLQYSTNSGFTSPTTINNIPGTTHTVTGLPVGTLYYVKVFAVTGAVVGDPSDVAQVNTTIDPPSPPTMATPTNTDNGTSYSTVWTWSATGACPTGTTMQFRNQYGYNSSGPYLSAWSSAGSTSTRTVTTSQGYTYTVYTQARCRSNSTTTIVSDWSTTASRAFMQPVTPATGISFSASRGSSTIIYMSASASCRSGAQPFGHFDEYSGSLRWTAGPNNGNYGWYTPGGWRITNSYGFSGGAQNSYAIPDGSVYSFRIYVVCRNSVTGAQSSGAEYGGPTWTWGSNV